jgi:hypothetical protein
MKPTQAQSSAKALHSGGHWNPVRDYLSVEHTRQQPHFLFFGGAVMAATYNPMPIRRAAEKQKMHTWEPPFSNPKPEGQNPKTKDRNRSKQRRLIRVSEFGLRPSFGLRISAFGFDHAR